MAQKTRSAQLTATAWEYCRVLVESGVYCSIDDAVSDLIMQVRRSTPLVLPSNTPYFEQPNQSTQSVPPSTTPVLPSTSANPIDALMNMDF